IDNRCFENIMAGIGIEDNADSVVRANQCYGNQMAGIGVRSHARAIIVGNICRNNKLAGIGCQDHADVEIRGNQCDENGQAGIGIESKSIAVIDDNDCHRNARAGIGVREGAVANLTRNRCIENVMVAVGVDDGSTVELIGNVLERSGGMPPIIAIKGGSSATILNNTIKGGGVAGVLLQGSATILDNQFLGNGPRKGPGPPNYATWVQEGSQVVFSDNTVDRWRHALAASKADSVRVTGNTTTNFLRTAIVISETVKPVDVIGNLAVSESSDGESVQVSGPTGVISENIFRVIAETTDGQ
ncbi:right-handed parallel beta-helix repeat-containing protein, partial [bacterium]|nr:right-handed parallel beta-helix repeat-containing protein [bacterium]